jgi:hypothetical protein
VNGVIGISDALGREVKSAVVKAGEWSSTIDISSLADGVYSIVLKGSNGFISSRSVIKTARH